MRRIPVALACCIGVAQLMVSAPTAADELRVAVASNFAPTLHRLSVRFHELSKHDVVSIPGSTGKLYAQIRNGAPFDVFFAADAERPAALEADGHCVAGSRFTYASGFLVLWTPDAEQADIAASLHANPRKHIAIANPQLAPYGRAAVETLVALNLWDALNQHLVRGENVAQTMQFVRSGNATLGFVSRSQIMRLPDAEQGSMWVVPRDLYAPIEQQAVLLHDTPAGRELLLFVKSPEALRIIRADGYDTP